MTNEIFKNEMMNDEQLEQIAGGNGFFDDIEPISVKDYHTARPTPLPYIEPIKPTEPTSIPVPKPDPDFQKPIDIKFFEKYLR